MSRVLGLSCHYHDAAAALVADGEIIAAAQEERFSRRKHDPRFPHGAAGYCLQEAFIEAAELDAVVFYDNPARSLDRVVRNALTIAPAGEAGFREALRAMLGDGRRLDVEIRTLLGEQRPLWYCDHHLSHAASAFYPSPFENAAILTIDGVGEHSTLSISHGQGTSIEVLREIEYPHSLGLLYSAMTAYCGFKVNSGEYKLMGLAPYGEPRYAGLIEDELVDLREDGSFALNMDYFTFPAGEAMTGERFHALFGGPPRVAESRLELRHMDIAASVQQVLEKAVLRLGRTARRLTGSPHLALAGGVALNCVANGQLHRARTFDRIWVQPAAGDAGGALGAALFASHVAFGAPRPRVARDRQRGSLLGPRFSSEQVMAVLEREELRFERIVDADARMARVAAALASGMVVGWFCGRMEYGPRALGARSILGDPRDPRMQSRMNLSIKHRESFRPFAPAVLHDRVAEWFEFEGESPYMLMVAPVRAEHRLPFDLAPFRAGGGDMLEAIGQPRSSIPAVTHVDHSARIQTVHPDDVPEFHRLLTAFDRLTGCPVLVNTSFNVRGEPIVGSPQDAVRCFFRTGMDLLVLEDCLVWRSEQAARPADDSWREEFDLD
jgi:carbamoyltransferase